MHECMHILTLRTSTENQVHPKNSLLYMPLRYDHCFLCAGKVANASHSPNLHSLSAQLCQIRVELIICYCKHIRKSSMDTFKLETQRNHQQLTAKINYMQLWDALQGQLLP